ncbi:MAG: menaquinone biosynthesis protein [Fibromonadaceae bacterium]|jgi:chorismate dehydratase|nr:menaquinone biosynthesis protein [Fibromonadaceae bacterium]
MKHFLTVGRIPFLVCAPFFHRFLDKYTPKVRFLDGTPSEQNKRLREGLIMLSPSSSIEYAKNSENYMICNRFCTASTLEIRSVKLFSKYKWENLGNKTIHITEQSDTSVALLKLLSSCYLKVEPIWKRDFFSEESCDARLLIGDCALQESVMDRWEYAYDLASVWQEWQNLPFVFGLWIIRKEALSAGSELLNYYLDETELSIRDFKENRDDCLQKWEKHYPAKLPQNLVYDYYNAVDYSFTAEHERSLKKFYELCGMPVELKLF